MHACTARTVLVTVVTLMQNQIRLQRWSKRQTAMTTLNSDTERMCDVSCMMKMKTVRQAYCTWMKTAVKNSNSRRTSLSSLHSHSQTTVFSCFQISVSSTIRKHRKGRSDVTSTDSTTMLSMVRQDFLKMKNSTFTWVQAPSVQH